MYANADGIKAEVCKDYQSTIDRYMISKCFEAIESIQASMNSYNSQEACKILMNFFEVLNNWYIRRSRERFWKSDLDQDKTDAYNVLYTVFYYILRAAAPLLPLITENIWQGLKYEETSVHLANFPQLEKFDSQLIAKMDLVRKVCNSALSIRNTFNIRIRQPLGSMIIYHQSSCSFLEGEPFSVIQVADTGIQCAENSNEYQEMIKDEVNVKELEIVGELKEVASLELKLNFPMLGKRIPDKIRSSFNMSKRGKWWQVEKSSASSRPEQIPASRAGMTEGSAKGSIFLGDETENYIIEKGEYELLLKANSEFSSVFDNNKGVVILNTELNDELILEGLARDVVRLIQETRKQADFHVSDRIRVIIKTEDEEIKKAINTWGEYIKEQTLSLSLDINTEIGTNFYSKEYQDLSVGCEEVVNLSNNSDDLGKVESISNVTLEEEEEFFDAMEEQESISNVEEGNNLDPVTSEEEEFFDALEEQEPLANFNVPLMSSGSYQKKHQNIEVSFREIDAGKSDIKWDMEIKFPPQFEQLLRDLYEDKDGSWFNVARDSEHNTILKLSAKINLKNGLKPLRNEINNVLATSIQEFAKAMEELMKLEKKDITYDKLKELLNEFRVKVVNSIGPKLTSHLIQNAYRVAFIQAIKFAQKRREEKEDFSLEKRLKEVLVEQELRSQGKELPSKKEIIIEDLKNVGIEVPSDSKDDEFSVHEAEWKELKELKEGERRKIVERKAIDIYKNNHLQATEEALENAKKEIERLRGIGQIRYNNRHKELKEIHGNSSLTDGTLKRRLEDLFKFEYDDQEVERRLIKSVIKKAQGELSQSGIPDKEKQSLRKQLEDLEKKVSDKEASAKINDFIEEAYLEIKKYKVQRLLKEQKEGVLGLCGTLKRYDESDLAKIIEAFRVQDEGHLEKSILEQTLKDQNERLQAKQREKGHPITKSIEVLLERNEAILETLEQLELKKEGLLINGETKNNYREELMSREKIKFAIIEDKLLNAFNDKPFNGEKIRELLEKAELEYCLAEKCIKGPVIKTKDNIKHFCQDLLSPLIDNLVKKIINYVPKDNGNNAWSLANLCKRACIVINYNRVGWSSIGDSSTEGKVLKVAHDTHKEVETFLQHFESSYEEVGAFLGDLFSDDGETFKDDVWPKIEEHLHGVWDRFFKDIEFKVGSRLDEVSTQQQQETVITV
ncbi:hypothetical protein JTE90_027900 [Oedothorax gibbosus]|uniref:Methionyl/Valyl/Leucyl/Isoleucyl-tRNA synthetase anticodon-binding domain-containing protein n=1 Tax=Oedothorax gibbosus TaxID=931172 RepID=A0AAV6TJJ8_9ARAC|nr:hypothetical protein JTE90_027900 [Oedothorax gibbosus]